MKKPISWILILLLLILSGVWADRAVNPRNQADALPESTYHTSWALLVGVNKYPNLPAHLQLNYAVNDVTALKEVLIQQYQFPESNIV
ncbi:caspase family protein, partial [Candidatus Poribacteria bacterium]|nr:caspase family protein [Candidatus Poribacteria bacterium]